MKVIYTSDWHLGHILYNMDRNREHEAFLNQLADIVREQQPDALLVSGDIFDTAQPSILAQKLYNRMMALIARENPDTTIVVTAGNHDGASRQEIFSELWAEAFNVRYIGRIGRLEDGSVDLDKFIVEISGKGFVAAIPYIYIENYPESTAEGRLPIEDLHQRVLDRIAERNTAGLPVIMMDHLAVSSCDITGHDSSKARLIFEDLEELGQGYDYLALGHIHKPQTLKPAGEEQTFRARYCGSPIPVSFDEDYPHSVSLITIGRHGDTPKIETIGIRNDMPIWNLPAKAGSLEEVKKAICAIPAGAEGYARINILVDDILPMATKVEIEGMMKAHEGVKLCTINISRSTCKEPRTLKSYTPDELRQTVDPIKIAKDYYAAGHDGQSMPEDLVEILEAIIKEVENGKEE